MDWLDVFSSGNRPMTPYGAIQGQPASGPPPQMAGPQQEQGAPLPADLSAIHALLASPVGDALLRRLSDPGLSLYDLGNQVLSMAQPQTAAPPQSVAGQAMSASTGSDIGYADTTAGARAGAQIGNVPPPAPPQPRQQAPQGGGGYYQPPASPQYQPPVPEHVAPPPATLGVPPAPKKPNASRGGKKPAGSSKPKGTLRANRYDGYTQIGPGRDVFTQGPFEGFYQSPPSKGREIFTDGPFKGSYKPTR